MKNMIVRLYISIDLECARRLDGACTHLTTFRLLGIERLTDCTALWILMDGVVVWPNRRKVHAAASA